jgi:hypothetical protein
MSTTDLEEERMLSDLNDAARQSRFEALQERMEAVWDAMKLDLDDESVVVVASVTVSQSALRRLRSGFCSCCCCCANPDCG